MKYGDSKKRRCAIVAVFGYQGQLGFATVATAAQRLDFDSEEIICNETYLDTDGLRGTRARSVERQRQGNRRIGGQLKLQPTAVELASILQWCLYGTPSGSGTVTYPLADAMPTPMYITIDRGSKVFTYNGCQVDKLTITGKQGEPLDMTLDIVGIDESIANSGTFPSLTLDTTTDPFIFTDLSLEINSVSSVIAKEIEIIWDNSIDKERFYNSQTITGIYAMDRHVLLNTSLPYGDYEALYGTASNGAGVSCVATFTGQGTSVLTITAPNVVFPRVSPTYNAARAEEMLPLKGTCFKSGTSTLETVVTLHT